MGRYKSEQRWSKLIDQAREEAKTFRKKIETLEAQQHQKMQRLKSLLADAQHQQQEIHVKYQVKVAELRDTQERSKAIEKERYRVQSELLKLKSRRKYQKGAKTLEKT